MKGNYLNMMDATYAKSRANILDINPRNSMLKLL